MNRPSTHIIHFGFITRDLEATVRNWIKLTHAGPFFVGRFTFATEHRGKKGELDCLAAEGFSNDVQIKIVQPYGDGPSIFHEVLEANEEGFHHIYLTTDDLEREISEHLAAGCELVTRGAIPGLMRVAFLDARPQIGCYVEIMERGPGVKDLMAHSKAAHLNWDGSDPIRYNFRELAGLE